MEYPELSKILETDNVATLFSEQDLKKLSGKICGCIGDDEETMSQYKRDVKEVMKMTSMKGEGKDKTFPFSGASNVKLPYLMEASIDFNARFMTEINKKSLVKCENTGKMTDEIDARIKRVTEACNYIINRQLGGTEDAWREDTDRAIMYLSNIGQFFRKNYQCPVKNIQKSEVVYGHEMIYNHKAESFYRTNRKSFKFKETLNEVLTNLRTGDYIGINQIEKYKEQEKEYLDFYECHCEWDLDGDMYDEPYIFTICKESNEIVQIVKLYEDEDITSNDEGEVIHIDGEQMFTQYGFYPGS
jgi:mRNA-degrading endonuclease YafQ of YafQ-DinJ toxin-antitoxin module